MKILKNNLYMLKIAFRAAPLWVALSILVQVAGYAVSTLISLYFMRYLIEALQAEKTFREAFLLIGGMFAVQAGASVLGDYVYQVMAPKGNIKVTALLMEMLYGQAVSVELDCYENPEFYDKYTKANEQVTGYAQQVVYTLTWVIGLAVSLVMTVAAIAVSEPFIIAAVIVPVVLEQMFARKYTEHKFNRDRDTAYERRQMEYVNRIVYQQEYAKELRLTRIFTPIVRSFEHAMEEMRRTSKIYGIKIGIVRFFRTILGELFVYLGVQSLIIYQYLVRSAYTLGELTTLLNASSEFSNLLGQFSGAWDNIYECGMFLENFRTFMEYETQMPENEDGRIPDFENTDIHFDHVSFSYQGSAEPVLKDIDLTIRKGQRIAIVGHNGAGKSTFVKLLMRLYDVTEGSIRVGGVDIREYRLSRYRELFGTIFQDFRVFAVSVLENVLLHGRAEGKEEQEKEREKAAQALRASGLYGKVESLKSGMDSQLTKEFDKEGVIMSGGEFQKLAIARVFAKECGICILDEPSSALDPLSEYEIFENMLKACEGRTVIFISHRLSSTVLADKIYLLEKGRIVESGSHQELMDQNGKYAEMYRIQAEQYKTASQQKCLEGISDAEASGLE